jgi:serine phosphatase RsbU (regulator of sigma subunit)/anti-sigma regulatory factor (Ser/Thr protein kinase)
MVQLMRRKKTQETVEPSGDDAAPVAPQTVDPVFRVEIPAGDPLEAALLSHGAPIALGDLDVASDCLDELHAAGVDLIVPLIGQGELLGALYLGPRLSDQPYSTDDRRLLGSLASQVAPAMKVAQLVREQQVEAKERERIQQELQVAALIQQTLLPKELPSIAGWQVDAFYRPARAVGGDFYDFIELGPHRLGLVIGDVTDKGVPAALVMATCRSMLRAAAQRHSSPAAVLADVNETLVPEIPPAMFVTCLYAILDTSNGEIVLANAGHNLPYVRTGSGVTELRATGMPLGLMPGMDYEERAYRLADGDVMVLTSDGITEAHSPKGEMYGFSRLMARVATKPANDNLVSALVSELEDWTGTDAEQEDDITLVVVRHVASAASSAATFTESHGSRTLVSFSIASVEGNERIAIAKVAGALESIGLEPARLERLKTAVGETVMNAIEHGNGFDPDLEVALEVAASDTAVRVRVTDHGGEQEIPRAEMPDLEAKLAGEQTPRGWGLFLIDQMVDEVRRDTSGEKRTVELIMNLEGGN